MTAINDLIINEIEKAYEGLCEKVIKKSDDQLREPAIDPLAEMKEKLKELYPKAKTYWCYEYEHHLKYIEETIDSVLEDLTKELDAHTDNYRYHNNERKRNIKKKYISLAINGLFGLCMLSINQIGPAITMGAIGLYFNYKYNQEIVYHNCKVIEHLNSSVNFKAELMDKTRNKAVISRIRKAVETYTPPAIRYK
ncbi:hypothetical protein JXB31_00730 [Candidatus Woesearchaeota archaeon]|nr:hypothetical protein [Candidatus Woesearchaeota archaeon]